LREYKILKWRSDTRGGKGWGVLSKKVKNLLLGIVDLVDPGTGPRQVKDREAEI